MQSTSGSTRTNGRAAGIMDERARAWEEARERDLEEYVYPNSPGATQCVYCMAWFYPKSHRRGTVSDAEKHMKGKC